MSADERPLTATELARLLRAFAALIERSVVEGPVAKPRRAPRVSPRVRAAESLPVDELTQARVREVFRRIGARA